MDLDLPLLVFVAVLSLLTGVRALRSKSWSFAVLGLGFALAAVLSYLLVGVHAGPWLFAAWFVLALLPNLLMRFVVVALHRQRYVTAERLAFVAYLIHPMRPMREALERLAVLSAVERGDTPRACAILRKTIERKGDAAVDAKLELLRLEERWGEAEAIVESLGDEAVAKNPALVIAGMRAYAELGRRGAMFDWFLRHERVLGPAPFATLRSIALLLLFAIAGRVDDARRIMRAQLPHLTAELIELWDAVASLASGDAAARARLEALSSARDGAVRRSARIYLERSEALFGEVLTGEQLERLDQISARIEQEDRFVVGDATRSRPWLTWVFATVLFAVYVLTELRGGSTEMEVLFELGALWPPSVIEAGEYHRLFAPLLLHYGPLHLAMNVAGLLVLAPFVERALGRARFAFVYFASGLTGTVLYVLSVAQLDTEPGLMVGASGCIMGMVGATAAVLLRGYRRERVLVAKKRLYAVVMLVVLQTMFDLLTPQVSFFAHSVGALTGFVLASLLSHEASRTRIV
jgi:rhomboid protease GluP